MNQTPRALLQAQGVTKRFGRLIAVNSVSLDVAEGEAVGIIGPNGSGKTTFLNLLSGLMRPNEGHVHFDGRDITTEPPHRRAEMGLARAFQVARPFTWLSVSDNIAVGAAFGARNGRVNLNQAYRMAPDVLGRIGMADFASWPVTSLSMLQVKLLEVGRALATRPKLLLLDEILAGVDFTTARTLMDVVKRERSEGVAIVIVEHRIEMLFAMVDRVIVLEQGQLIADGTPKSVANDPHVIRAYLGQRYSDRAKSHN